VDNQPYNDLFGNQIFRTFMVMKETTNKRVKMGKMRNILIINNLENSLLSINTLAKQARKKLLKSLENSVVLRIFM